MAGGISRRAFVGGGAIAVTMSALPSPGLQSASGAVWKPEPEQSGLQVQRSTEAGSPWARSRFVPFVGSTFRMTDGHEDVDVVLTKVTDLDPVQRTSDEKRFLLLFAAAGNHTLADGIRTFRHAGFGEIDMFVSPAGRPSVPVRYQVIVNRL